MLMHGCETGDFDECQQVHFQFLQHDPDALSLPGHVPKTWILL